MGYNDLPRKKGVNVDDLDPKVKDFAEKLYERFPDLLITDGKREKGVKYGSSTSHHFHGGAIDIKPSVEVYEYLMNTPEGLGMLYEAGLGVYDETDPRKMEVATGAHFHIGTDPGLVSQTKSRYESLKTTGKAQKVLPFNATNPDFNYKKFTQSRDMFQHRAKEKGEKFDFNKFTFDYLSTYPDEGGFIDTGSDEFITYSPEETDDHSDHGHDNSSEVEDLRNEVKRLIDKDIEADKERERKLQESEKLRALKAEEDFKLNALQSFMDQDYYVERTPSSQESAQAPIQYNPIPEVQMFSQGGTMGDPPPKKLFNFDPTPEYVGYQGNVPASESTRVANTYRPTQQEIKATKEYAQNVGATAEAIRKKTGVSHKEAMQQAEQVLDANSRVQPEAKAYANTKQAKERDAYVFGEGMNARDYFRYPLQFLSGNTPTQEERIQDRIRITDPRTSRFDKFMGTVGQAADLAPEALLNTGIGLAFAPANLGKLGMVADAVSPIGLPTNPKYIGKAASSVDDVGKGKKGTKSSVTREDIIGRKKELEKIVNQNRDYINSDYYINLRMKNTGESKEKILKEIEKYNKRGDTFLLEIDDSPNSFMGSYEFKKNEINLSPSRLKNIEDALETFDHEVKHMFSPIGINKKAYKNYPKILGRPSLFQDFREEIFDINSKAPYYRLNEEQQVRNLRFREAIQKDLGLPLNEELTRKNFDKWLDNTEGESLVDKLNNSVTLETLKDDVKNMFLHVDKNPVKRRKIINSKAFKDKLFETLRDSWSIIPAAIGTGTALNSNAQENTQYQDGGTMGDPPPRRTLPTRYTEDRNDPGIRAYADSLKLYKTKDFNNYSESISGKGLDFERFIPYNDFSNRTLGPLENFELGDVGISNRGTLEPDINGFVPSPPVTLMSNEEEVEEFMNTFINNKEGAVNRVNEKIKPIGFNKYVTQLSGANSGEYAQYSLQYKKPVQPVKYRDPINAAKQQQLVDAGYDIGEIDGIWGKKSKAAWDDMSTTATEITLTEPTVPRATTPLREVISNQQTKQVPNVEWKQLPDGTYYQDRKAGNKAKVEPTGTDVGGRKLKDGGTMGDPPPRRTLPTRYTSDPNDPGIKSYADSLSSYNYTQQNLKKYKETGLSRQGTPIDFSSKEYLTKNQGIKNTYDENLPLMQRMGIPFTMEDAAEEWHRFDKTVKNVGAYQFKNDTGSTSTLLDYKKPVQPVKHRDPKVVAKQQQLIDAGYDIGGADGIWGKKSKAAWDDMSTTATEITLTEPTVPRATTPLREVISNQQTKQVPKKEYVWSSSMNMYVPVTRAGNNATVVPR